MRVSFVRRGAAALGPVLVVALAAVLAGGCQMRSAGTGAGVGTGVTVTTIAVVTPEKANDFGWNQQAVECAQAAARAAGAECIVEDGAGYGDITPILHQVAAAGPQLVFPWASGYNTVASQVAQQLDLPMTVCDAGGDAANVPGLVNDVETDSQNGAYLAGVLAARMTRTGTVAIVVSAEDLNWSKMAGGFIAGARATTPAIAILYVQIGQAAYADAAGGKRVTVSAIAGGADIVFGMGDGASFGMLQACETATPPAGADKVWFIDVIGDKSPVDTKGVYLSSVVWDFTPIMSTAIAQVEDGTFGMGTYWLDLQNGLSLLKTRHIPGDVWDDVTTARAAIVDGAITVPVLTSSKAVKAMLAGGT